MTGQGARDDEREALIRAVRDRFVWHSGATFEEDADAYLAALAPYWKHPEPEITDEMVDRAASSVHEWALPDVPPALEAQIARAALEAALRVPVGEGEQ